MKETRNWGCTSAVMAGLLFILVWWLATDWLYVRSLLRAGAILAPGLLIAAGLILMGIRIWQQATAHMEAKARAAKDFSDAHRIVAPGDSQVFERRGFGGDWAALHRNPNTFIDGRYQEPRPSEMAAYRDWLVSKQPTRAIAGQSTPLLPEPEPQAVDILAALRRTPRALIVGASDAGKSTILLWLAEQMVHQGDVVIIDPHSYPDKWPTGCDVVGTGSRHELIEQALDRLVALMVHRYKEIGAGSVVECGHPRIAVIVDEWMSIADQCHNAKLCLIRLLTESRKAAFSVYVGSHSGRVRSLGLDGRGDLREGFEIYHLEANKLSGQRRAWLEVDGAETPLSLPGPYAPGASGRSRDLEPIRQLTGPDARLLPTDEEARILELHRDGVSLRGITDAVWGQYGAFYNSKVQETLEKFGEK